MLDEIKKLLLDKLPKAEIIIEDDSASHRGHAGVEKKDYSTSHVNIKIVSEELEGVPTYKRHRIVNDVTSKYLLEDKIHALSYKLYSKREWEEKQGK